MVLTRGWTLTSPPSARARSSTSRTARSRSLIAASGVTDPGLDAQMALEAFGAAERKPPCAQRLAQPPEVDVAILQRHHQPHLLLLVAQEEVLDVMAGQGAAMGLGLLHGEDRGMLDGVVGQAQLGEAGE